MVTDNNAKILWVKFVIYINHTYLKKHLGVFLRKKKNSQLIVINLVLAAARRSPTYVGARN